MLIGKGEKEMHENSDVNAYLERIGFKGAFDNSAQTLAELQHCHLHTVPYENLDILQKVPLSLEIPDLYEKIVVRQRGGYCFELNALFSWLLRQLGFSVTDYFARFWRDEPNLPPKRRHHVLKVEAEGKSYLCDVGVGGIVPRRPIEMVEGLIQTQGDEVYKLEKVPEFGWMLYEKKKEQWREIFSFTEEPQLARDYIMASFWCEHAPESIFTKEAMIAIRTKEGRNSVSGQEFRIFTDDQVHAFTPASYEEYKQALQKYFGIVLPDEVDYYF
ncbi:acetyltransferase [Virgibacillus soli]|uniref:Acetyltransferase n=2 Tax=Lederbergia galactosidilytica TaxID=217031 RepID=A0A177ZM97_9BACI|nr:acetyltransferase [Virgibacillus soli]OAK69092.1 acetyltransferase [Lederbergia galactosidilytica]